MTLDEKIANYDADPLMHYYVYFSISSYTYAVDVIKFKKIEDVKSNYYVSLAYYDTYAEAKAAADDMTAKDDNIKHIFCREFVSIRNKLGNLRDTHYNKLTEIDATVINTLLDTTLLAETIFDANVEK